MIGGDGRFYNREVIQIALQMAAANGFGRVLVGRAASSRRPPPRHVIRKHGAFGGIILSASHNPGGPTRISASSTTSPTAARRPRAITDAIFARTQDDRPLPDRSTPPTSTSTAIGDARRSAT